MRRFAVLLLALCSLAATAAPLPARGTVEVLFTPWDDAEGALLAAMAQARRTIHVQAYVFTSRNIARALEDAHRRGVRVAMLVDLEQTQRNERSLVHRLHDAGIPVWFEVRHASAHNKIMLIDAEGGAPVVVTGSYNFTYSAQARNAENLVIMRGNEPLARRYLDNWRRHHDEAVPYLEKFPS
ncbi:MAG: phospholipase D family protein [Rhodocyclaceae bacterium]|nr:phospholipase D family protein [Rhodocyclaceae bacterium]MBK6553956.1 phospholipase D family protein [Rhodocyclaceae bacterium]MBK6678087.1 phospholipase D family protein [Rhodocyclaceae bacterium]MBK7813429.1 phospholipase D family protein [Rhodocyclaceae bacterium]MBK9310766.1 phospholipase D family protein [Rhodocyclaceae bacterium]